MSFSKGDPSNRETCIEIVKKGREVVEQLDQKEESKEEGYFISLNLVGTILSTLSTLPYNVSVGLIAQLSTLSKLEEYYLVQEPKPVKTDSFQIEADSIQEILNVLSDQPEDKQKSVMTILNSLKEV